MKAEGELVAWLHKRGALTLCGDERSKFAVPISSANLLAVNEEQVSICRFMDWHPLDKKIKGSGIPEHFGLVEKVGCLINLDCVSKIRKLMRCLMLYLQAVISQWQQIFEEDIQAQAKPVVML